MIRLRPALSRRRVLAAPIAALTMLPWRRAVAADDEALAAVARLAALMRHRASARVLGRAYLAEARQEASPTQLACRIGEACGAGPGALAALPEPAVRHALAAAVRRDFTTGNTVVVRGWVLARTEARLYALCA
jgi:hypothetical protein